MCRTRRTKSGRPSKRKNWYRDSASAKRGRRMAKANARKRKRRRRRK